MNIIEYLKPTRFKLLSTVYVILGGSSILMISQAFISLILSQASSLLNIDMLQGVNIQIIILYLKTVIKYSVFIYLISCAAEYSTRKKGPIKSKKELTSKNYILMLLILYLFFTAIFYFSFVGFVKFGVNYFIIFIPPLFLSAGIVGIIYEYNFLIKGIKRKT